MKKLLFALGFSLLAIALHAQQVTFTASHLMKGDQPGNGIACMGPAGAVASGFQVGSTGQAGGAICRDVVNGVIQTTLNGTVLGPMMVPDTQLSAPANPCFNFTARDPSNTYFIGTANGLRSGYACVQPTSDNGWCTSGTCNFDLYVPTIPEQTLGQSIEDLTVDNLTVNNCTGSGCGSGGAGATLETNGVHNPSQTTLNIQNGVGTTASNPSGGNVQMNTTYGSSANTAAQGNDSRIIGAEQTAHKGAANGYAPLDMNSLVPLANLPSLPESMVANLVSDLAAKALDSAVVHNTGAEAVAGVKTFSSSPGVPTPTNPGDSANKSYVDASVAAGLPSGSGNQIAATPADGSSGQAGLRAMVPADVPSLPESKTTNLVSDLAGKEDHSALAAVAESGSYTDLSNKPTIPAAQIQSDWNESNNLLLDFIKNKPSIPAGPPYTESQTTNLVSDLAGKEAHSALAAVAESGSYTDLSNKPTIPAAQIQSDWNESNNLLLDFIKNKPSIPAGPPYAESQITNLVTDLAGKEAHSALAAVAESGSYTDLSNKPTIPAAQIQSDWNESNNLLLDYIKNKPSIPAGPPYTESQITNLVSDLAGKEARSALAAVAESGSYTDLSNTPTSLPPSGAAGGKLSGTYPNPGVNLASGDVPNNAANTSGTAANLSGAPTVPNGTKCTTQTAADNTTDCATDQFVQTAIGAVTGVQKAAEPVTPSQAQIGLNTGYLDIWTVPGVVDNATTPNLLYAPVHLAIDDDVQNMWTLQQLKKCLASIEVGTSGSFCVLEYTGDSDISGVSATSSPIIQLNARMQSATTGWGYAGPGFLSVGTAHNVSPTGVTFSESGAWSLCGFTNGTLSNGHSGACWGPDNQDLQDSTSGDFIQWATSGTTTVTDFFFYYAKQSGGGSFQPSIDAVNCGSAVSTNGSGIGSVHCTAATGTHTAKLAITTSGSPVDLLGAIGVDSTHNGVVTLRLAAAANEAQDFALNPNWNALMAQIQSDLSGASGFATGVTLWAQEWSANEWGDNHTPASMLAAMSTLNAGFTSSGSSSDFLIMTDNDNGNSGTTNSLGFSMWQYDYAEQQFANKNQYAFFSVFRNSYPARTSLCGVLHLTSVPCQSMITTLLLDRMTGHSINYNVLNPMTTLGDFVYGGALGQAARLAGNTAASDKVPTSTGTGSAAQAPVMKNNPALAADNMTFGGKALTSLSTTPVLKRTGDVWTNLASASCSSATLLSSPISLISSPAAGTYMVCYDLEQKTTGNCTTPGSVSASMGFADGVTSTAIAVGTGNKNLPITQYNNFSSSSNLTLASSLSGGTSGSNCRFINVASGTALNYQAMCVSGGTTGTCSTQATFQFDWTIEGPF